MAALAGRRTVQILLGLLLAAAIVWFARPTPVPVDLATVRAGPMEVTIDEEAKTRVRNVYTVSAPLTGTVLRIEREPGDMVVGNETVVALMKPAVASFHDPRLHQELQAAWAATRSAVALAQAERRRIAAALTLSRQELARIRALSVQDLVARNALDRAVADVHANEAALASADAELQVRRNQEAGARARLRNPAEDAGASIDGSCCVRIRSPVTGRILAVVQESEAVVPAGAPLLQIGDASDLEIVAELLSTDAVRVRQGDRVHIDGWGGPALQGRVRRVEPTGFLKVSALGIEEQRVRTLIDLSGATGGREPLGHDYRVVVHVVTWSAPRALQVPVSALFRSGDDWAVYLEENGRARLRLVRLGHRNSRVAHVLSGLSEGDRVVLHASDRVNDGARIASRN